MKFEWRRPPLILFIVAVALTVVAPSWSQSADPAEAERSAAEFTGTPLPPADPAAIAAKNNAAGIAAGADARKTSTGEILARIGIIAVGSYPIALLYTNFGFDMWRYAANDWNSLYAPWPFRSQYSILPDTTERIWRYGVAAGVSLAVGIADSLLQTRRK